MENNQDEETKIIDELVKKGDYEKLAERVGIPKPDDNQIKEAEQEFKEIIEKGIEENPSDAIIDNIKFDLAQKGKLDAVMPKEKRNIYIRKISNNQQTGKNGVKDIVAISLQGRILRECNFWTGDIVRMTPSENKLIIEKIELEKEGDWIELKAEEFRPECDNNVFIKHIQTHLSEGQEVICKICGKTAKEIIENKTNGE